MARAFDTKRTVAKSAVSALTIVLVACSAGEASPPADVSQPPSTADGTASGSLSQGVVAVSLSEMHLAVSSETAPSGKVTFQIKNSGELPHELVVIRTDKDADELPVEADELPVEEVKVVERRLKIVARSEHLQAAQEATLTVDLAPGHYVLICNLSGHYEQSQFGPGMRADLEVR
jgi:uncharacterized cupredoxin-like copper-binding protein